jgi:hypothetical protein
VDRRLASEQRALSREKKELVWVREEENYFGGRNGYVVGMIAFGEKNNSFLTEMLSKLRFFSS